MSKYTDHFSTTKTPQTQPIPGKDMVENKAGGFVFGVGGDTILERFLILGAEGGTYYASERELTVESATSILSLIKSDGVSVVEKVVEVSQGGKAPKNNAAIFVLAMCAGLGDAATKKAALDALPKVCRIGTHLFSFLDAVQHFRGWGRALRTAVANWYLDKDVDKLAYQVVKYRQRDGWTHRDALRLSHPKTDDAGLNTIFQFALDPSSVADKDVPRIIEGFLKAQDAKSSSEVVSLIKEFSLPREAIPTEFLNDVEVGKALLTTMPLTALIRNLGSFTKNGILKPLATETGLVVSKLTDADYIRKSRVHPMTIFMALKTYESGRGFRGRSIWEPVGAIVNALNDAFYKAFDNVTPTGKRILIGVDVSGSMNNQVSGVTGLTAKDVAAAMAFVTAKTEPNCHVMAFASKPKGEVALTGMQRLDDLVRYLSKLSGGTDCAAPVLYALEKELTADAIVIYTDNESYAGNCHPVQAMETYRKKSGINSKLISVAATATNYAINENDENSLVVCGFDTAAPQIISQFIGE